MCINKDSRVFTNDLIYGSICNFGGIRKKPFNSFVYGSGINAWNSGSNSTIPVKK
jgi:hypothetical protein